MIPAEDAPDLEQKSWLVTYSVRIEYVGRVIAPTAALARRTVEIADFTLEPGTDGRIVETCVTHVKEDDSHTEPAEDHTQVTRDSAEEQPNE